MEAIYEETEVKVIEEVETCYTLVDLPSPSKKKRSKACSEHADKPKKPRSAYLLYYFDVHQSLQQKHPDMPQYEINKCISDNWRSLSVAEKGYYLERAKMEKDGVDPSAQSKVSSQDVPGFRKILPRTSYVLFPKNSLGEERPGASIGMCMEAGVDSVGEEASQTSIQEPLVSPLTLGSEVELVEHCIAVEALGEDAAQSLSRSAEVQGILHHYPNLNKSQAFVQDGHHGTTLLVKEGEVGIVGEAYGGVTMAVEKKPEGRTVMPQVKTDTTHLVAIIPDHELMENKVLSTANPIMVLPVMNHVKPDPKPSVKLSITYTRRGRGSCSTPGCSFTYVTRHKPPHCPDCGQHLGGKWMPPTAKGAGHSSTSSQPKQQRSPGDADGSPTIPSDGTPESSIGTSDVNMMRMKEEKPDDIVVTHKIEANNSVGRGETVPARTIKGGRRKKEMTGAVTSCRPTDGALNKNQHCSSTKSTVVIGSSGGHIHMFARDRSGIAGQKRRVRAILPAPAVPCVPPQPAVVQLIAVPSNKIKPDPKITSRTVKPPDERILGLKPSTLKQLGHSVSPGDLEQKPASISSSQYIVTDNGVKILSMVPLKPNPAASLSLGLSTARGRGKCKTPSCDYVYKNRHKPQYCPSCGCELSSKTAKKSKGQSSPEPVGDSTAMLDPYQPLSPSQRELQRQSTVALLRQSLQYPENEAELQDVLSLIHSLNHAKEERDGIEKKRDEDAGSLQNGWPRFYESAATHCSLCHCVLYKGEESCSLAGLQQCWLLTESVLQPATLQLKMCLNPQCLAVHSFTDLHPALFNIGNQLLVSFDLFFKIRNQIKLGQDPTQAVCDILDNINTPSDYVLTPEQHSHVQDLLCSGYWAFECLTVRDYNDMICGVCGIAPKLEIAQRNTNCVLQLKNVEFTWPEFQETAEVQVEEFWLAMESEALEQAAFPSNVSITRFDASIIAPFFPPLMRSALVINTEKDKLMSDSPPSGDPSVLVRLIHDGHVKPELMDQHTEEELRYALQQCGITTAPESTKDEMMVSLCLLYSQVQNGLSTVPQPPQHVTAGKLSKLCPHQVVCGSKYLVRAESARDHVDLLLSSRFWPPVYVADCAQKVALCADTLYPELTSPMWGRNQGCFSDPMSTVQHVSCTELQEQQYSVDLAAVDSNPRLHPLTRSPSRWIVCPDSPASTSSPSLSVDPHRAMSLCTELQPYSSLASALSAPLHADRSASLPPTSRQPLVFDNAAHYYLYNRLMDFLTSRDIVSNQIAEVLKVCQQGEVVMIRDALYRLGVAQLNTEEEEEEKEQGQVDEEGGADGDVGVAIAEDVASE